MKQNELSHRINTLQQLSKSTNNNNVSNVSNQSTELIVSLDSRLKKIEELLNIV
jgi:hypothetical protein